MPLVGRDTIADYGMLCDVLLLVLCCLESCPVQSMHLHDRREALYFRGKPELNHGSTGLSYTNGGWNNREWLDEDKQEHEFHMPRCCCQFWPCAPPRDQGERRQINRQTDDTPPRLNNPPVLFPI